MRRCGATGAHCALIFVTVGASSASNWAEGAPIFLLRRERLSPQEIEALIHRESGLLGVSGISGEVSELLKSEEPLARLALDLYVHRVRKYLGAYMVELGGLDGIAVGGGVGENVPEIRERIFAHLEWIGIRLDKSSNENMVGKEGVISTPDSKVEIRVVPVQEEIRLAEEALSVLSESPAP
jgi:acetate kinase